MPESRGEGPRLALVGAAGIVGSEIVELINQRDFTFSALKLFGLASSAADEDDESAEPLGVLDSPRELADFDIVFLAVPPAPAAAIVASGPGPILIDLSAASRPPTDVIPLAAPGLTPRAQVAGLHKPCVVGVPHPAAQVIASILSALGVSSGFAAATVLVGASSQGREAIDALFNQSVELLNAQLDLADEESQKAFNLFLPPFAEELAQVIAAHVTTLTATAPALVVQVAQVPAFHGTAVALFIPAATALVDPAARLREAPGIVLVESGAASSLVDATSQEAVITKLSVTPAGAAIWCVFDAARMAALSAVWIAETAGL